MMINSAPATEAVAIERPKAMRLMRLGLAAISCRASLSCETARMARPMKVRPKKTCSTESINSETRNGTSMRNGRSTKPRCKLGPMYGASIIAVIHAERQDQPDLADRQLIEEKASP